MIKRWLTEAQIKSELQKWPLTRTGEELQYGRNQEHDVKPVGMLYEPDSYLYDTHFGQWVKKESDDA